MHFKLLEQQPKTYMVTFDAGEEIASGLERFASEQKLAGSFKATGAFSSIRLGWFDSKAKNYRPSAAFDEQTQLVSLMGDIAINGDKPHVQAQMVVAKFDGTAHGGHLLEARVDPTCQVLLIEAPQNLHRQFDPHSGLALVRP